MGEYVDARRVEAVERVLQDEGIWALRAEKVIAAADEAVGGVVSREIADALAEIAQGCLRHGNSRTRANVQRALAAYRRATGDATRDATG